MKEKEIYVRIFLFPCLYPVIPDLDSDPDFRDVLQQAV